ncbi:MAG: ComEC/Rec2 family competence protein [Patescibacteria group bacterium]|nr:ComEC/Rec2 family competence protein [Patescibacteria group bacterium]
MKWERKVFLVIIFLLVLANFFVWQEVFGLDGKLKVIFFDVGQGEAIFIETGLGHQILIDGGPSERILEKLAKELPFWDKTLDLVILTHPEKDHLFGLNYVLERYKVENIFWTGVKKDTKTYGEWQEKINKEQAKITIAQRGQKIKAGEVQIFIFYPLENLEGKLFEKNSNDSSLVAKLFFGKNTFLFTGDITEKTEKELLIRDNSRLNSQGLASQVLKVAHHGSKTSSSKEFLAEVLPEIAIISCGRNNPSRHPHQETLHRLQEFAIKILRTDEVGDIKIVSDGNNLQIKN